MKNFLIWDKYDNKYREVVDVEVARGLEADLYEANNRIVDLMNIIDERDKIIDEMANKMIAICTGIVTIREQFEKQYCEFITSDEDCCWKTDKSCVDCIKEYFEKRCKNAKD